MERKLFSSTDSTAVEVYKGISKVAIETGFPCIPNIQESEGGEGSLFDIMA